MADELSLEAFRFTVGALSQALTIEGDIRKKRNLAMQLLAEYIGATGWSRKSVGDMPAGPESPTITPAFTLKLEGHGSTTEIHLHGEFSDEQKTLCELYLGESKWLFSDWGTEALMTDRQLQILELTLEGKDNEMIGRQLGLSPHTVRDHLRAIQRQLEVDSKNHLLSSMLDGRLR